MPALSLPLAVVTPLAVGLDVVILTKIAHNYPTIEIVFDLQSKLIIDLRIYVLVDN